jgi:hypothetical protein
VRLELLEVVGVVGDVLTRVVAVPVDELGDLRLLGAVDALDKGHAEVAVVDAPDLHAAVGVAGTNVVDAIDEVPPSTSMWNHAHFSMVPAAHAYGDVIDLLDVRHAVH